MPRFAYGLAAVLLASTGAAYASTTLTATLNNANENPPTVPTLADGTTPRPASFGTAVFVINDAMTSMSFQATINNIDFTGSQTADVNDNLVAAHIHAPGAPGTNGPVVWGFFGMPFNDNNPNDVMMMPFLNSVGGMISGKWDLNEGNSTTFAAQLSNILNGLSYINFHTTQYGGGEIRGQILAAVPEPETYALMLGGLGAAFLARRRRK